MSRQLSMLEIARRFSEKNLILGSVDCYENNEQLLPYQCIKCSHADVKSVISLMTSGCRKCGQEKSTAAQKLTIKEIAKRFSKKGLILGKVHCYENNEQLLPYQCKKCGHKDIKSVVNSSGCRKCGIKKCADSKRSNIQHARVVFKQAGLKLKSKIYVNARQHLAYKCLVCGYEDEKTLDNVVSGRGCPVCTNGSRGDGKRLSLETVRERFTKKGLLLLSTSYKKTLNC